MASILQQDLSPQQVRKDACPVSVADILQALNIKIPMIDTSSSMGR